jgi:hypothetical protein
MVCCFLEAVCCLQEADDDCDESKAGTRGRRERRVVVLVVKRDM